MLSTMFVKKVKDSFSRVRYDVSSLRQNTDDWIRFLDGERQDLQAQIKALQQRVRELELLQAKNL